MSLRSFAGATAAQLLFAAWTVGFGFASAQAQSDYPTRAVRIIVPTGAGGATDLTARTVSRTLSEALGQPFVVENRPGAHGLLAANMLLKEKRDGYTLLMMATSQAALPALYEMPYDPVGDFSPIALLSIAPVVFAVNAKLPVTNLAEFISYAKQHPKEISYGYQSNTTKLSCAQFAKLAGFEAIEVPFAGSAQVATELIAGRVTFTLMTTEQAKVHVESGSLRALATAGNKKADAFPDLPLMQDLGYPIEGSGWFGLVGPAGMPKAVADKIYATIKQNYYGKDGQAAVIKAGLEAGNEGPEEFTARMRAEIARWNAISADLGIKKSKL